MRWTNMLIVPVLAAGIALAGCAEEETADENVGVGEEVGLEGDVGTDATGFGEWDSDADAQLTSDEFGGWAENEGLFSNWDNDGETGLTEDEWGEGVFGLWDGDNDDQLTESEWNEGANTWFGGDYGTFADWDANQDDALDTNEFNEGLGQRGFYDEWDTNRSGMLEENEYNEGLFGVFDENEDTYVAENEWNNTYGAWDWGVGT